MAGAGLAVALLMPSAWVLLGARQGSCRGVGVVSGKGLAGGLVDFLGQDPAEGRRLLVLIRSHMFMILTKICMPPQRRLPSLGSNVVGWVGACGLKGGLLCWHRASCPGKALAGAAEAASARILPRESTSPSCSPALLVLVLPWLSRVLASLRLPFSALLSMAMARGSDCPCTSKGVKRRAPTFVHRQEPPGLGHT